MVRAKTQAVGAMARKKSRAKTAAPVISSLEDGKQGEGEEAVATILNEIVCVASESVANNHSDKVCAHFAAASAVASIQSAILFSPVAASCAEVIFPEDEPYALPVDRQAVLHLRADHRLLLSATKVKRRKTRPASAKSVEAAAYPKDPRCFSGASDKKRLFALADTSRSGSLTAEQIHAWLSMQGGKGISLSLVKKLVSNHSGLSSTVDAEAFAKIMTDLATSHPRQWGHDERLCVYAVPRHSIAPIKDHIPGESELREKILGEATCRPSRKSTVHSSPAAVFTQNNVDGAQWGDSPESSWGKTEVVTGNMLTRAISSRKSSGRDDRLQGIAAQVKITSPHRKSSRPGSATFFRTDTTLGKRSLANTRASSSNIFLSHSRSMPSGVRFQAADRPAQTLLDISFSSRQDTPQFRPQGIAQQSSLVENHEFIPRAGVSATDRVGHEKSGNPKKVLVRKGPSWPPDPKHMSKQAYDEVRAKSVSKRPSTAPALTRTASLPPPVATPKYVRIKHPRPEVSTNQAQRRGKVVVLHPDMAANLLVSSAADHSSIFAGASLATVEEQQLSPSYGFSRQETAVLASSDHVEAGAVQAARSDTGNRIAALPTQAYYARLLTQPIVSRSSDAGIVRERHMPVGKAMRVVEERRKYFRRHPSQSSLGLTTA